MGDKPTQKNSPETHLLDRVFGMVLREKRKALGLRLVDLETVEGIKRSQFSYIENGDSQICLRGLFQVADALEETPEDLIAEVRRRYNEERKEKAILPDSTINP